MKSGIITYSDIERFSKTWADKHAVLVGGCFDVLHFGHVVFLEKAKAAGDVLIIALESDAYIKKVKKRQAVHSQAERAYILSSLKMIDYVILLPLFEDDTGYHKLVEKVKPQVIAVTEGDAAFDKKKRQAERIGGELVVVTPLLSTFSTTNILNHEHFYRD